MTCEADWQYAAPSIVRFSADQGVVTRFSTTSSTSLAQLSKRVRQSWIDVKIVQWTDGGSVVDP
jgi:hypothetical protein